MKRKGGRGIKTKNMENKSIELFAEKHSSFPMHTVEPDRAVRKEPTQIKERSKPSDPNSKKVTPTSSKSEGRRPGESLRDYWARRDKEARITKPHIIR